MHSIEPMDADPIDVFSPAEIDLAHRAAKRAHRLYGSKSIFQDIGIHLPISKIHGQRDAKTTDILRVFRKSNSLAKRIVIQSMWTGNHVLDQSDVSYDSS